MDVHQNARLTPHCRALLVQRVEHPEVPPEQLTPRELEVLRRTNQVRTERGLQPLQWDSLAYRAALGHARDMLERSFFAHRNPDGLSAGERMQQAGVLEVTTEALVHRRSRQPHTTSVVLQDSLTPRSTRW